MDFPEPVLRLGSVIHALYANGCKCDGEFVKGKLNGKGTIHFPDGSMQKGMFQNGVLNGRGVWLDSDGRRYEGEFKKGQPDGHGVIIRPNGTRFEGEFKNGEPKNYDAYSRARHLSVFPLVLILAASLILNLALMLRVRSLRQQRSHEREA